MDSRSTGIRRRMATTRRRTVAEVLRGFFDDDALIAPAIAVGPTVWGLSPDTPRSGLGALTYAMKHVAAVGRPVGGSGGVPDAVLAAFRAASGTLRTDTRVSAIVCDGGRVRGVEAGTELIEAPIVVSACDPRSTFLHWLRDPPPCASGLLDRWRRKPQPEGYEMVGMFGFLGFNGLEGVDGFSGQMKSTGCGGFSVERVN